MEFTVSLGQMHVVLGDPAANLAKVEQMTAEAARRGSEVVVFPELWSTGYDLKNASRYASELDEGIFAEIAALARANRIHIFGSNLSLLSPGRYGNTAAFFSPDGLLLGHYSKAHLFRLMDEHQYLTAGDSLGLVDLPWGRAGLAVCYDLRFPELFRACALAGASMVFLPAEWPHPRLAHWQILLRARAIENQMFIIACNRVGQSGADTFFGHSCVIDPAGEALLEAGDAEALLTVQLQMDKVDQIRKNIPVFQDRRSDVYNLTWIV